VDTVDIILIEDNPTDVELTLYALQKHKIANHVKVINDGAEAIGYLSMQWATKEEPRPLLILLDLNLPKVGGIEILRWIRSNESTKLLPVVVLTSSALDRDRMECYKLGVNSYIVKPVEFDNFARVIAEIGLYWIFVNRLSLWYTFSLKAPEGGCFLHQKVGNRQGRVSGLLPKLPGSSNCNGSEEKRDSPYAFLRDKDPGSLISGVHGKRVARMRGLRVRFFTTCAGLESGIWSVPGYRSKWQWDLRS
jgi:two-component system, response regulator